ALGGGLGVVLGVFGVDALVALDPADVPRVADVGANGWILGGMLGGSLPGGVGFGLLPPPPATAVDLGSSPQEGRRGATAARRHGRLRAILVVSQFALALPLLVGAGLMTRSFVALTAIDPGFDARGVAAMQVSVAGTANIEPGRRAVLYPEM